MENKRACHDVLLHIARLLTDEAGKKDGLEKYSYLAMVRELYSAYDEYVDVLQKLNAYIQKEKTEV